MKVHQLVAPDSGSRIIGALLRKRYVDGSIVPRDGRSQRLDRPMMTPYTEATKASRGSVRCRSSGVPSVSSANMPSTAAQTSGIDSEWSTPRGRVIDRQPANALAFRPEGPALSAKGKALEIEAR